MGRDRAVKREAQRILDLARGEGLGATSSNVRTGQAVGRRGKTGPLVGWRQSLRPPFSPRWTMAHAFVSTPERRSFRKQGMETAEDTSRQRGQASRTANLGNSDVDRSPDPTKCVMRYQCSNPVVARSKNGRYVAE